MAEYVTLVGADDVRSAGHAIREAAFGISSAASNLDYALERHRSFMDDWLQRFEAAIDKLIPPPVVHQTDPESPVAKSIGIQIGDKVTYRRGDKYFFGNVVGLHADHLTLSNGTKVRRERDGSGGLVAF